MTATAGRRTMQARGAIGRVHRQCPLCGSPELDYEFIVDNYPVCACRGCSLLFLNPQPGSPAPPSGVPPQELPNARIYEIHETNATSRLEQFLRYAGFDKGRLLLVGAGQFLEMGARRRGFEVVSLSPSQLENNEFGSLTDGRFEGCILYCALETLGDPLAALAALRQRLAPQGCLMVICPTLDSRTARLFRSTWWEFTKRNRYYFSADTLQNLLLKAGYGDPVIMRDDSVVSLQYMREKLARMPSSLRFRLLKLLLSLSPGFLRHRAFRFLHSRTAILVRPKPQRPVSRLSVIVPVYNERATFHQLMETLLTKTIEGVEIEVIVIESNSTDGTREHVLQYKDRARVTVILEERPRGKGHAVRRGLEVASGDIILFQDADLEYDIDDYDALLEPILRYQQNFIIGSRHTLKGNLWKIRQFNDSTPLTAVFNLGHITFLTLFNLIYQQKLKDPFSMFKVFRRECLYGLQFECNRFDFDFEITIKLLRKGYKPLELPVNYRARSFKEGKKVTLVRDPLTWLRALVKFRNSPLYPDLRREVR